MVFQNLNVSIGEVASKAINDIPLVCDLGMGTELAENGRGTGKIIDVVLESDNVASGNRILGLSNGGKGGRSGECLENEENECDELPGEHGCLEP